MFQNFHQDVDIAAGRVQLMITAVLVHGLFGAFGDQRTWSRLTPSLDLS